MRTERRRLVPSGGLCVLVCLINACAARSVWEVSPESHRPGTPRAATGTQNDPEARAGQATEEAAPGGPAPAADGAKDIESQDPELLAALTALAAEDTGTRNRRVAEAYRRVGILDTAHRHLTRATDLDRTDAAAYDGLARIWRDWGFASVGLGDAYRAVYFAPASPAVHNTLGTLLQALGQGPAARQAYMRALAIDTGAAYALNNLCYLSFLEGALTTAEERCRAALRVDPGLAAARNNLALVYAAAGCLDCARREFLLASDAVAAQYNLGIVYLAQRDYARAARAFDAAVAQRPALRGARARARQARALSTQFENGKEPH